MSSGETLTAMHWRANRLVDFAAKAAAQDTRVGYTALRRLDDAKQLLEHEAAEAGYVTHAANNFRTLRLDENGNYVEVTIRDMKIGYPPARIAEPASAGAGDGSQPQSRSSGCCAGSRQVAAIPLTTASGTKKPHAQALVLGRHREELAQANALARWVSERSLRPSAGPAAFERMQVLRERVRAREESARGEQVGAQW